MFFYRILGIVLHLTSHVWFIVVQWILYQTRSSINVLLLAAHIWNFWFFKRFTNEVLILSFKDYRGLIFEMLEKNFVCSDATHIVYFFPILSSADIFIVILLPSLINYILCFKLPHLELILPLRWNGSYCWMIASSSWLWGPWRLTWRWRCLIFLPLRHLAWTAFK